MNVLIFNFKRVSKVIMVRKIYTFLYLLEKKTWSFEVTVK